MNKIELVGEKAKKKYQILFVDDEKSMLNSIRRGLHGTGFNCLFTDSAKTALTILKENENIALVVSDLKMPEMNGIEFLRIVNENYPNIIKIALTGNAQIPNILATINESKIFKYLIKPWKLHEEFIPTLTEALYMFYMKNKTYELLEEETTETVQLQENQIYYFEKILELIKQSDHDIELIHKVAHKLPFFDKQNLEKLSLYVYSRSENIHLNLESISTVIENIIKFSKKED